MRPITFHSFIQKTYQGIQISLLITLEAALLLISMLLYAIYTISNWILDLAQRGERHYGRTA